MAIDPASKHTTTKDGATFRHVQLGPIALLAVVGRVGPLGAAALRRELENLLLGGERRVVVDCRAAWFEGLSGPVVLLLARRVMRAHGGTLTLTELGEQTQHGPLRAALRGPSWDDDVQKAPAPGDGPTKMIA